MISDDERREVARRLRKCTLSTNYTQAQGGGWSHLCDMALAVGLKQEDRPTAWDLAQRLADLIEPSEPKVRCVAEVKLDGERLEQLVHDAAVELTGIDRGALLKLADEISGTSCDKVDGELTVDLITVWGWAQEIRDALGVSDA